MISERHLLCDGHGGSGLQGEPLKLVHSALPVERGTRTRTVTAEKAGGGAADDFVSRGLPVRNLHRGS
jgi:hypothetical protein